MNLFLPRVQLLLLLTLMSFGARSQGAQTYTGSGGSIPDDQTWVYFPVTVFNLNHNPLDTTWGFEKVTINITHTWDSDLEVWLVSPDSNEVMLFRGVGGDGDNFTTTVFSNNYTTSIAGGTAPFTGNFRPMGDLGAFNNTGHSGNGVWKLKIRDNAAQDQGNLVTWALRFSTNPSLPYSPTSSNLPIIKIDTHGQGIIDNPKIAADFMIIDNGPGNRNYTNDTVYAYQGNSGFELRGSSSQSAPKLSYGFETWDSAGNSIDTSLLGMPAQSDWILAANYFDKTMMRNVLSYHLANQTGHYAVRTRYCELFLNGQYQGVFVLMEKIKRDKNRVDIAKLTTADTAGDALTGGYILKIDKFTGTGGGGFYSRYSPSNPVGDTIFIQYDYPKDVDILPVQADYIQKYVDSFETALFGPNFQDPVNGFRRYASEKSMIDYLFINEMSKNVDGYRLSTFFYKDKQSKGGKIHIGPVWDYDIAWMNADYCNAPVVDGWAYNLDYVCAGAAVPAWWERLRQDSLFNQHLYCRWNYLRSNIFSFDSIFTFIDSTASYINEGQQRNFTLWAELGVATWPEPTPLPQTYPEEIQRLKDWISNRFAWLDIQFNNLANNPVPVSLGNDTTVCAGTPVRLYAGEFDSYSWSTGDTTPVTYTTGQGAYSLTVTDNFHCLGTDDMQVTEMPVPVPGLGNDTTVCNGNAVLLNAMGGNLFQWSIGSNAQSITVSQTGSYGVTVTNNNGCTGLDNINVYVQPIPNAAIQVVQHVNAIVQFASPDTAGKTIAWYFGDGDSSSLANPLHDYSPATGTFAVTHIVTDNYGCSSIDTTTVTIVGSGISELNAEGISLYPNPASNVLIITSQQPIEEIKIMDVIGNLLYKEQNPCTASCGKPKEQKIQVKFLPSGVYFVEIISGGKSLVRRLVKD